MGTTVHDKATVTSANTSFPITGTVTFQFYSTIDCTDAGIASGSATVDASGVAHPSDPQGPLAAGSYGFKATYGGNANFTGSTGTCEPLTVNKAASNTVTEIHDAAHNVVTSVALGTTVHDKATVTSANTSFPITGTVTFQFYSTIGCTDAGIASGSATVDASGVAHPSDPQGPLAAGSYGFKATYGGNANFTGSTGTCEPLTVNKAASNTVTEIHDAAHNVVTSVALGTTVHDKATVTSANTSFPITGTVTFQFYSTIGCTDAGIASGSATVDASGVAHPSDPQGPLAAGSYGFKATYGGNANFTGSTGTCEPLTVNKAASNTVTEIHDAAHNVVTSVALGTTVHDKATVTSANTSFPITGTVTFQFYSTIGCTDAGIASGSATVDASGVAHPSDPQGPLAAGSYGFKATYGGNANFTGSTGTCEPLTVNKAASNTVTEIHDAAHNVVTSVALGTTVHDKATVTSANTSFPITGTVTFQFYSTIGCTDAGIASGSATVDASGVAHPSDPQGPLAAGSYGFKATYGGNANFTGSTGTCEPLTVNKAASNTVTEIHDAAHNVVTSVALGTTVHDKATVTSANTSFPITGTVTFQFYSTIGCTDAGIASGSATVDASGVAHPSDPQGPLAAGSYGFRATYGGNANFTGSTSTCEPLTVNKAASNTVTEIHDAAHNVVTSVALGTTVHDKATVTSANTSFPITGTVTFQFYSTIGCTDAGIASGSATVDASGVAHPSDPQGPLAAGSYGFKATYGGNANFTGSTGTCEPLTVNKAASTTVTELHTASEAVIPLGSSVALGTNVHDKATVTSANDSFPVTGTVTFTFFTNGTCDGEGTGKGTVALVAGVAHPSDASGALAAGDYAFRAHYNGDGNFDASTSACEPFHVSSAGTTTATELHNNANETVIPLDSSVALGTNVHDQATVTDANPTQDPTGTVTFTFFANSTCDGAGVGKGTVALNASGIAHPSDASGALAAGDYAFRAHYNGDANFDASTSACEPFHVNTAASTTVTELHNNASEAVIPLGSSVALGTNVHDKATVTRRTTLRSPIRAR